MLKYSCWILVLAVACNKEDEEVNKANCNAMRVEVVDGSSTIITFNNNGDKGTSVNFISVHASTDSSYAWGISYPNAGEPPNGLTKTNHNNSMIFYTAEMDGNKVSRFLGKDQSDKVTDAYKFLYSSDRMSEQQGWLANATGVIFQVSSVKFYYDGDGNLIKTEEYADFAALFSLLFGVDPTGYAPLQVGLEEYGVGDSPNPLYGEFWVDQMYWCVGKNLPTSITYKDLSGSTIKTETLTLTKDGNNYPTKASISATKYMEAEYVCQ